jgi:plasmid stabilization system protein ParE
MKLVITDYAKDELRLIYEYYAMKASVKIVSKLKSNIISAIKTIADNSFLFQTEETLSALGKEHRRMITGNYKII